MGFKSSVGTAAQQAARQVLQQRFWDVIGIRAVAGDAAEDFQHISSSQVKTFETCARKWWFEKVCGVKQRSRYHFAVGHALHDVAERYLLREVTNWDDLFAGDWGKGLEPGDRAWVQKVADIAVQSGIWQSVPGALVEAPVSMLVGRQWCDVRGLPLLAEPEVYEDAEGVRKVSKPKRLITGAPLPLGWDALPAFVGFMDYVLPAAVPVTVQDHKTAKNRRYTKTSKDLGEDVQVLAYAAWALARYDCDVARVRHNVFLKDHDDHKAAYVVEADVGREVVAARWATIIETAEDMAVLRSAVPAQAGPKEHRCDGFRRVRSALDNKDTDACGAYGGCPFKDACFNRKSVDAVIAQLDAPDPQDAVALRRAQIAAERCRRPPPLVRPAKPSPAPSGAPAMPFHKAKPTPPTPATSVGSIVGIKDPENDNVYTAVVTAEVHGDGVDLAVYPVADRAPDIAELPDDYRLLNVPKTSLVPPGKASLAEALLKANGGYPTWKAANGTLDSLEAKQLPRPSPVQNPATASTGPTIADAKVTARPAQDPALRLRPPKAGALPAPVPALAPTAAVSAPPAAPSAPGVGDAVLTYEPKPGMLLEVLPQVGFWSQHVGKHVQVIGVLEQTGKTYVTVVAPWIDAGPAQGLPIGDLDARRFKPVQVQEVEAPVPTQTLPEQLGVTTLPALQDFVGQLITVQVAGAVPFTMVLDKVAEGKAHFGVFAVDVAKVSSFSPAAAVPPAPPKVGRPKKGATATATGAAPAAPVDTRPSTEKLVEMLTAALAPDKRVTRKVVEEALDLAKAAETERASLTLAPASAAAQPGVAQVMDSLEPALVALNDVFKAAAGWYPGEQR